MADDMERVRNNSLPSVMSYIRVSMESPSVAVTEITDTPSGEF